MLKEEATDDDTQKSIRRCLLSFFRAFDAETLPPPSVNQHVMQNIENPAYQKDLNPNFLHKVEYIRKRIFKNCEAKRGFTAGSVVSGFRKSCRTDYQITIKGKKGFVPDDFLYSITLA